MQSSWCRPRYRAVLLTAKGIRTRCRTASTRRCTTRNLGGLPPLPGQAIDYDVQALHTDGAAWIGD